MVSVKKGVGLASHAFSFGTSLAQSRASNALVGICIVFDGTLIDTLFHMKVFAVVAFGAFVIGT